MYIVYVLFLKIHVICSEEKDFSAFAQNENVKSCLSQLSLIEYYVQYRAR